MKSVDDPLNGYRISVPQTWDRTQFPHSSGLRFWFVGAWSPPGELLAIDGLFVHLMVTGVPAADFGKFLGERPVATSRKPEKYTAAQLGAGTVGSRPAYRLDARYSAELGEVVEAVAYVEIAPGCGALVISRAAGGQDAMARARLEAALAGFDAIPRTIELGAMQACGGGLEVPVVAGFEAAPSWRTPAPWAFNSVGPQDTRNEYVAVYAFPRAEGVDKYRDRVLRGAMADMKPATSGKVPFLGAEGMLTEFVAARGVTAYEVAVAGGSVADLEVYLVVQAATLPKGRAIEIAKAVAPKVKWDPSPVPKLSDVAWGDGKARVTAAPEGWEAQEQEHAYMSSVSQTVDMKTPEGEQVRQLLQLIQVEFVEDASGHETPQSAAAEMAARADPKKAMALGVTSLPLPGGAGAARLILVAGESQGIGSWEMISFLRVSPGAMVRLRHRLRSVDLPSAAALEKAVLERTRYARLEELPKPDEETARRSRELLPRLVERARALPPSESWSAFEQDGKVVGGVRLTAEAGGRWSQKEVRLGTTQDAKGRPQTVTITTELEGSAEGAKETLRFTGPYSLSTVSTIRAAEGGYVAVSRVPDKGDERTDRLVASDLLLPPDLSVGDSIFVALADAPEGRYVFQTVSIGTLTTRFREFVVGATEEVDGPGGKVRARRVQQGKAVLWIAGGRVVLADYGSFRRKHSRAEDLAEFFK